MDPNPSPHPTDSQPEPPEKRLAALSLRSAHLPPDFAPAEIQEDDDDEGYLTAASRGGSSSCAAAAWKDEVDGLDDDKDVDVGPPSPSSSGYAGERGSSLASSAGVDDPQPQPDDWARDKKHLDEVPFHYALYFRLTRCQFRSRTPSPILMIDLPESACSLHANPDMSDLACAAHVFNTLHKFTTSRHNFQASTTYHLCPGYLPGHSSLHCSSSLPSMCCFIFQDDASASWRKRKKHFFILSNSGKPIYSRYGDEHKLAGFSATLQAIISFVENSGDHIKFVRAGKHQIVFLVKGPIYLVCISCTQESYEGLRGQLELMYGQMLLILTKSINKCFEKNPKFDMASLLGGTDAVFLSLIHAFSWNPATFLHAYTCIPLAQSTRKAASAVLQDVADSGVLFALLMCEHKVISLVGAQKETLHPDDIFLLSNFILSSESFRTSESFSPICIPRYNPMAFLYAYVHFFDENTYLTLLTSSANAFYDLKDSRSRIQNVLLKANVLDEVQKSLRESALRIEDLPADPSSLSVSPPPQFSEDVNSQLLSSEMAIGGPAGLWHFIYKSIYLDQYVSSEFPLVISNPKQQKRLYKAYKKMYASMHDKTIGPHKTQFRRDEDYVLFCWITQDFELYAAFNPLADKMQAIKICNRVCQWIRDLENEIFVYGESTLSW